MGRIKRWDNIQIRNGFEKFFQEYGRYPTVLEIDGYEHLPSARQIQRRWPGGVKQLRQELGIEITDFTKGAVRSETALSIGKRGLEEEQKIRKILVDRFGEICVHEQSATGSGKDKKRFDFIVYTKGKKVGLDVFYPAHKNSISGCINSKQRNYDKTDFDIIFILMNKDVSQDYLDALLSNKKNELCDNVSVLTLDSFLNYIVTLEPLKIEQD